MHSSAPVFCAFRDRPGTDAIVLAGGADAAVIRILRDQRDQHYCLLRGFFHGADDGDADLLDEVRLHTLTLPGNDTELQGGETLVLSGRVEVLARAEQRRAG